MLRLKKYLRLKMGLTQQQVSDALGIERALYVRYENGTRNPPDKNLIKLADFFQCTADYLLGRPDIPRFDLTDDELLFLKLLRKSDERTHRQIMGILRVLVEMPGGESGGPQER